MFDIPKLFIANSGPNYATYTTSVFIQSKAFEGRNLRNEAAAASLIMFVIIVICSAALFYIMRDKDEIAEQKAIKKRMKAERRNAK